jgi:hypothetical protein
MAEGLRKITESCPFSKLRRSAALALSLVISACAPTQRVDVLRPPDAALSPPEDNPDHCQVLTGIVTAIEERNLGLLQEFLRENPSANVWRDRCGPHEKVVFRAIRAFNQEALKMLLAAGFDACTNDFTLGGLAVAAEVGNPEAIRVLLAAGCDVDVLSNTGPPRTPLCFAISGPHEDYRFYHRYRYHALVLRNETSPIWNALSC